MYRSLCTWPAASRAPFKMFRLKWALSAAVALTCLYICYQTPWILLLPLLGLVEYLRPGTAAKAKDAPSAIANHVTRLLPSKLAAKSIFFSEDLEFGCLAFANKTKERCRKPRKDTGSAHRLYTKLSQLSYRADDFKKTLRAYADSVLCASHVKNLDAILEQWTSELVEKMKASHLLDSAKLKASHLVDFDLSWQQHEVLKELPFAEICTPTICGFGLSCRDQTAADEDGQWAHVIWPSYVEHFGLSSTRVQRFFGLSEPRNGDIARHDFVPIPQSRLSGRSTEFRRGLLPHIFKRAKEAEHREGFLYAYTTEGNEQFVKIGFATDIEKRLGQWQRQCGMTPLLRYQTSIAIANAKRLEGLIHWDLQDQGLQRANLICRNNDRSYCTTRHKEWFEADVQRVNETVEFWLKWLYTYNPWSNSKRTSTMYDELMLETGSGQDVMLRWREELADHQPNRGQAIWKSAPSERIRPVAMRTTRRTVSASAVLMQPHTPIRASRRVSDNPTGPSPLRTTTSSSDADLNYTSAATPAQSSPRPSLRARQTPSTPQRPPPPPTGSTSSSTQSLNTPPLTHMSSSPLTHSPDTPRSSSGVSLPFRQTRPPDWGRSVSSSSTGSPRPRERKRGSSARIFVRGGRAGSSEAEPIILD
jgi:hypothetical protein